MIKLFHRNNRHLPEVANGSVHDPDCLTDSDSCGAKGRCSGAGLHSFTFQDPTHLWRRGGTGWVETEEEEEQDGWKLKKRRNRVSGN